MLSGIGGAVNGKSGIANWNISTTMALPSFSSGSFKGGMGRLKGVKDWNGSYRSYKAVPEVKPGAKFNFAGCVSRTSSVSGEAIVDRIELKYDIENAKPVEHIVYFSGNDELTVGSQHYIDVSTELTSTLDIGAITFKGTEIPNVRSVTITLSCANSAYSSSEEPEYKKREPGVFDANVSINVYAPNTSLLMLTNGDNGTFVCSNVTISNIIINEVSNLDVNIETGAIISATIGGQFTACDADGVFVGSVLIGDMTIFPNDLVC